MELFQFLDHPIFKDCYRSFKEGEFLFKAGELGETMFIILEGKVRLISADPKRHSTIALMCQGEFLGEKVLVLDKPYERQLTAEAITSVRTLELGKKEIAEIQSQAAYLLKILITRSFEMAEDRLKSANELARILRSTENKKRLVPLIKYLARRIGWRDETSTYINDLANQIYHHTDMELDAINIELDQLVAQGILERKSATDYRLLQTT